MYYLGAIGGVFLGISTIYFFIPEDKSTDILLVWFWAAGVQIICCLLGYIASKLSRN